MVLNPTVKPNPTWSPVYADITDPKLTNWLWVTREQNKQRDRFLLYQHNKTVFVSDEQDKRFVRRHKHVRIYFTKFQIIQLIELVTEATCTI